MSVKLTYVLKGFIKLNVVYVYDQASYNVWKDKEEWLNMIQGVQSILATCVDSVTENIFYIVSDNFCSLRAVIKTDLKEIDLGDGVPRDRIELVKMIYDLVIRTLGRLERLGLTFSPLSLDTILVSEGLVFLQNQLIVKSSPGKTFQQN